jgi:hypothetical protein
MPDSFSFLLISCGYVLLGRYSGVGFGHFAARAFSSKVFFVLGSPFA